MISGTITDRSGRFLSGQTPEAFWNSIAHAAPLSVGLNCALGAKEMRAHIAELARVADTLICAYPNAGLPNEFGGYDEGPEVMAELIGEFADGRPRQYRRRLLRHDAGAYSRHRPRGRRQGAARHPGNRRRGCGSPGSKLYADAGNPLRQRRRAHQRHRLGEIPQARHRRRLSGRARCGARSGRERRADHRHQHGRGPARFRKGDGHVPQSDRRRARHRPRAGDDRFLEILGDRGRAQMRAGQTRGQFDLAQGGRRRVHPPRRDWCAATAPPSW